MHAQPVCSAEEALQTLRTGNLKYIESTRSTGDISPQKREQTLKSGQHPYAVIITCSDSRVVPEYVFSADIGDLYIGVMRNDLDDLT